MPMYAVDENGDLYVVSPDQAQSGDYFPVPDTCDIGDLTLGSAFKRNNAKYQADVLAERRSIRGQEESDWHNELAEQQSLGRKRRMAQSKQALLDNPQYQQNMLRKALMGCACDANKGQNWMEMDNDQKIINQHMGKGKRVARHSNPSEVMQLNHEESFKSYLAGEARKVQSEANYYRSLNKSNRKIIK